MRSSYRSLSTANTVARPIKAVVFDLVGVYLPVFNEVFEEYEAKVGIPKGTLLHYEYKVPVTNGK